MASTQLSPGVVVLERDLTSVANATVDNIAAIVGSFEKGPIEKIVNITSEKELLSVFGRPNDFNYEYWFSAAQFLLYGGSLKVIRANNSALKNAIDTAQFILSTFSASDTTLTVASPTDITVGDLLLIDAEILTVSSVSGNDISVARGQLASSAASHAAGASITLIEETGTSTTINEGATFSSSDLTLTVTSAATLAVNTNDYIRIDDEILRVSAIVGNALTVVRAQLNTTAAAHTDGSAVDLLTITTAKTTINESTTTGVAAPLIKNIETYESTIEDAANNWKWAARNPGNYGNSLRVVMTDAGADQILALNQPTTSEWEFTNNSEVSYTTANIFGKVYNYSVVLTLKSDSTLVGDFAAGNFFTANSGNTTGRIVAWDRVSRKLEISISTTSSAVLSANQAITELSNNNGVAGTATGDSGSIESIERKLYVYLNQGSPAFQANQTIVDSNAANVLISAVRDEYEERTYGKNQKWINVAPKPATSQWAADRGGSRDQFHILVIDGDGLLTGTPGSLLEKHLFVSKASDAKGNQGESIYYKEVLKNSSNYVYWGSHETTNLHDVNPSINGSIGLSGINRNFDIFKGAALVDIDNPSGTNAQAVALIGTANNATLKYSLQGGIDGYELARPDVFSAYDLISDAETENVDYILCGPSMSTANDSIAKAQKVIDIAANRKDCIAFVSPQRSDIIGVATTAQIVDRTITFFNQLTSTSYAVFDNNYKYVYDKYNDKYRYIPCNADVAGLTLSTTLNQEPWYSPAGFNRGNLKNAIKLAYSPLKDQRDQLYNGRVNPIVSFPGQGIILFGDKTALSYQSAFDRINIRRLFLVIEEAISGSARSQLFELNDEFTRSSFKNLVEPYLRSVQARRGIVDFLVVCDASNNPPEAIDRGEFYAEIFVKPTKSVNYITLTFTATRTGASFAEVTS
jgi:hypothetical protein